MDKYRNSVDFDVSPFTAHISYDFNSFSNFLPWKQMRTILNASMERITFFTSFSPSECRLVVLLNGKHHINGSPWKLLTDLGPSSASLCTVFSEGPLTVMTAGLLREV